MRLVEAARPFFARHETFHPRYGWFRKAYAQVAEDPRAFLGDDAPVRIGVGKNMVRALRFWGLAAKLIEEDPNSPNRRAPDLRTTNLGDSLFGKGGWDEYMEDPGTLWLLHWLLLAPPCHLPVWWIAFNAFNAVEFSDDQLESAVETQLDLVSDWRKPHPSSRKKDVGALLRTYAPQERTRRVPIDDLLDCPLRELDLIGRGPDPGRYRFALGPKPTLPSGILAYAVLDYIERTDTRGNTVTVDRLTTEPGAPGRGFMLNEAEMLAGLEPVVRGTTGLDFISVAGGIQLAWSVDHRILAIEVLNQYYGVSARGKGTCPTNRQLPLSGVGGS